MQRLVRTAAASAALACLTCSPLPAEAQGITTVNAKFDAWSPGDSEKMSGRITVNALTFSGTVRGRTTKGVRCKGAVTVNLLLDGGSGHMSCTDGRTGKFTYTLTSSLPPRGTGIGKMSNGKTVKFRIKPG